MDKTKLRYIRTIDNNRLLQKVLHEREKKKPLRIIKGFDFDDVLFSSVGTYEKDYDLEKFKKDNTFFRNLFTKELPHAEKLRQAKKKGDYIAIITAREHKWWFKLLLWIKNIPYDDVKERPKSRENISSHELKLEQARDILDSFPNYVFSFYDDSKLNCDTIEQGIKLAIVHKI
jgi:hypothetical protein